MASLSDTSLSLSCPGFNFSIIEKSILSSLSLLFGIVSCIACLYIFIVYMINKCRGLISSSSSSSLSYSIDQTLGIFQGFNDQSSMIVFLAFSDFFLAISSVIEGTSYLHNNNENKALEMCQNRHLCTITSSFSVFFGFSSFLWTAAMSHSSYTSVAGTGIRITSRTSFALLQCSMFRYHVLCWGLSLLPIILLILSSSSGPYSNTCWITTSEASSPYNSSVNASTLPLYSVLLIYILPLLLCEAYNIHVFRFLASTLKRIPNGNALLNRFTRYLSIVIGTKALYLITRIAMLFAPLSSVSSSSSTGSLILSILIIIGGPIQGCGDFIIFRDSQGRRNDDSLSRRGSRGSLASDNSDSKDVEFVQVNDDSQEGDATHNPINGETRGRQPYRVERHNKRKSGKGMYMMIGTSVIDKNRSMSIDTSVTEEGEDQLDDSDDDDDDDDDDDGDEDNRGDEDDEDLEAKVHLTEM